MKKTTFIILLVLVLFADLLAMGLMFSDMGAVIYLISILLFAAVLAPFFLKLKKETDDGKKGKIRRNMILILLIPVVIAMALVAAVVISMLFYFG